MKDNTQINHVERGDIDQDVSFKMEFNAKAASILADSLYKDNITAVIRELSCNARDAMIEAGKGNESFTVHLPSQMEPWFSVEDNGIGMSQETASGLFTTFFSSTKTNTNAQTGMLGLGSKSPFSYVDSYVVETRFDGVLTTWTAYRGEEGIPRFAKMSESPTDRPNGVLINMAVKQKDFESFRNKATQILSRFDPIPVITGRNITIEPQKYRTKNEFYGTRQNSDQRGVQAIMGSIAYPVDISLLPTDGKASKRFYEQNIDLFFEIGELDITPSREALQYTAKTKDALMKAFNDLVKERTSATEIEMRKATTYHEAQVILNDLCGHCNVTALLLNDGMLTFRFGGKTVTTSTVIRGTDQKKIKGCFFEKVARGYTSKQPIKRSSFGYYDERFDVNAAIIVNDLDPKKQRELTPRLKAFFEKNSAGTSILVTLRPDEFVIQDQKGNPELTKNKFKDSAVKRVQILMGRRPVILLSEIEKAQTDPVVKNAGYTFDGCYNAGQSRWSTTSELDLSKGGYYVVLNNYYETEIPDHWSNTNYGDDRRKIPSSFYRELDEIVPGCLKGLVGVRKSDLPKMTGNWVNLFDHAKKVLQDKLKHESHIVGNQNELNAFRKNISQFSFILFSEYAKELKGTGLGDIISQVLAYKTARTVKEYREAEKFFGLDQIVTAEFSADQVTDEIMTKYPMLKLMCSGSFHWYSTEDRMKATKTIREYVETVDKASKI